MKSAARISRSAFPNYLGLFFLFVSFGLTAGCSNHNRGGQYSNELEDVIDLCRDELSNKIDTPVLISSSGHGHSEEVFETILFYYPEYENTLASIKIHVDSDGKLTITETEDAPHNDWMIQEIKSAWANNR